MRKNIKKRKKTAKIQYLFFVIAFIVVLLPIIIVLMLKDSSTNKNAEAALCQKLLVPAYFYPNPTTLWDQAIASAPTTAIMIVNPASGPGAAVDANYASVIANAKSQGVKPIGYITSSYTNKSLADFVTEIDTWKTLYGVTDIFVDEVTSDAGHLSYYDTINTYAKAQTPGATVVINPGTVVDEGYTAVADIITIFESPYTAYLSLELPSWINNYPATKFYHLIYGVPDQATMQTVLALAQQRNAGYVYVTDDTLPNPWDTLPPYWNEEVTTIQSNCSGTIPTSTIIPATATPLPTITNTPIPTRVPSPTIISDAIPPVVAITFPTQGSSVQRSKKITIKATASDNKKVRRVKFFVNGSFLCSDTSAPYQCNWIVPYKRGVTYTLRAEAWDTANNSSSHEIKVTSY